MSAEGQLWSGEYASKYSGSGFVEIPTKNVAGERSDLIALFGGIYG